MKNLLIVLSFMGILLVGCVALDRVSDPNTIMPVSQAVDAVGAIATAAGQPWGWILSSLGGGMATLAAMYLNWRNKTQAANKYTTIEMTTKAIVDAIEAVSVIPAQNGTIGDLVKAQVKANLSDKDWYQIGKAIITGLKSS